MSDLILARFWSKVDKGGPVPANRHDLGACWIWTAGCSGNGYGSFHPRHSEAVNAHAFAYRIKKGRVRSGLELDHLCRVRRCVNPDHMEPVTRRVNVLRGSGVTAAQDRKTHCAKGHPLTRGNLFPNSSGKGRGRCRECHLSWGNERYRREAEAEGRTVRKCKRRYRRESDARDTDR